jgi:hypothetical protein
MYLSRRLQTLGAMTVATALAGCGGSSNSSTTALTATTPPLTVAGVVRCLRQGGASLVPASNRNEAAATGPGGGIIVIDLFGDPAEGKKAAGELTIEPAAAGAGTRQVSTADDGKVVLTLSNHPLGTAV